MGYVYFVQDLMNKVVKIGASEDPETRFRYLQQATVADLVLLRYVEVPDCFQTERRLHVKFADFRVRGEWFKAEPELLEFALSGDVASFSVQPLAVVPGSISTSREICFTLKELSEKTGVSARNIRYYIANKVLSGPIGMGPGAHYSQFHVDAIQEIQAFKDAGYSLDNIASSLKIFKPAVKAVPIEILRYKIGKYIEFDLRKDLPPLRKRIWLDALAQLENTISVLEQDDKEDETDVKDERKENDAQ